MTVEQPETLEELDRAERRRRVVAIVATIALAAAMVAYLFVPRTLEAGETDEHAWSLRVAPVPIGDGIRLVGTAPIDREPSQVPRAGGLDGTVVWRLGDPDGDAATIVVGPTPSSVSSVRVTTEEFGVGEARVERVGWRRFHVDRLPGHVEVVELVAIDADGRPIEVSQLGVGGP